MDFRKPRPRPYCQTTSRLIIFTLGVLLIDASVQPTAAQDNPKSDPVTVAIVNGISISDAQVKRDLARTLKGITLSPLQSQKAFSATLEKLINQRIALEFLNSHNVAASDDEVMLRINELENQLATVEKTVDDYLTQTSQTLDELKFQTAWQVSWQRYLDRKLSDAFLESHFNENKRRMDGTKLRVAHLLLKTKSGRSTEQKSVLENKARSLIQKINKNPDSWNSIVAQYSDAPTKASGGEIGWIQIDGPMPNTFTQAAFELSTGEISPPITSPFGIHVIKCLEVEPGNKGWRDVIKEVKKSAAQAYFNAIVDKHRPQVEISRPNNPTIPNLPWP